MSGLNCHTTCPLAHRVLLSGEDKPSLRVILLYKRTSRLYESYYSPRGQAVSTSHFAPAVNRQPWFPRGGLVEKLMFLQKMHGDSKTLAYNIIRPQSTKLWTSRESNERHQHCITAWINNITNISIVTTIIANTMCVTIGITTTTNIITTAMTINIAKIGNIAAPIAIITITVTISIITINMIIGGGFTGIIVTINSKTTSQPWRNKNIDSTDCCFFFARHGLKN